MVFVAVARSLAVTLHFGQLNKKIWPEYCYLNLRPDSAADKSCLDLRHGLTMITLKPWIWYCLLRSPIFISISLSTWLSLPSYPLLDNQTAGIPLTYVSRVPDIPCLRSICDSNSSEEEFSFVFSSLRSKTFPKPYGSEKHKRICFGILPKFSWNIP